MKKHYLPYLLLALIGFLLISCGHKAPLVRPDFKPVNLDARLGTGEYRPKVDNFIVILDASGSKQDIHNGATNLSIAKDFLTRMNMTLPNLKLQSALRTFGFSWWPLAKKTTLHYGFTNHTQQGFQSALDQINRGGLSSFSKSVPQANILKFAVAKDDPEISDIDAVGACADTNFFEAPFAFSNIDLISIESGSADARCAQQLPVVRSLRERRAGDAHRRNEEGRQKHCH